MLTILSAVLTLQAASLQQRPIEAVATHPGPGVPQAVVPAVSRAGRHALELGINLSGSTSASTSITADGVTFDSKGGGFGGSLTYTYWAADRAGVQVYVSAISADASVSVTGSGSVTEASNVASLLVGLKLQPFGFAGAERLRPYVSGGVGAYLGNAAGVTAGLPTSVASRRETVVGARAGAGFDVLIGRRFTLGVGGGYRFMGDFREPIGGRTSYGGAEVVFSFGVLIGHVR